MKIGFFGTGLMGSRMAKRLIEAGHEVMVYNRTVKKTRALREAGAKVAESPAEASEFGDVLIPMLSDGQAVKDVILGEAREKLDGRTVIQMSTIGPAESEEIGKAVMEDGGDYIESPVLGSTPQAEQGKLILMVGADEIRFNKWLPLLSVFGSDPVLVGPPPKAAALKLAMNQLIAGLMATFSLSYAFTQKQGVRSERFMEVMKRSALFAPMFESKFKNLFNRDFANPNFPSKHLLKDVDLFLEASKTDGLDTTALEAIRLIIATAVEHGHASSDYSSMFEVISG